MPLGFWLVVALIMGAVEAGTTALVTMWFVVGALAAFLAAFLGAGAAVQLVVFLAVSLLCLALIRPVAVRHRNAGPSAEPSMVGASALVTEAIPESGTGRVETADHMSWAARAADGAGIGVGESVRVVAQESIVLVVERKQK